MRLIHVGAAIRAFAMLMTLCATNAASAQTETYVAETPPPTLRVHNNDYQNACTPQARRELAASLSAYKIRARMQAWKVFETLLCGKVSKQNVRFISGVLAAKVDTSFEATASEPAGGTVSKANVVVAQLFARGFAYDARIHHDGGQLEVHYTPNEACVESRTLRHVKGRWRLVEYGDACD